uniref:IG domain-containing protein n=1 Tax=Macrostomum lignano TaxID=282301 RepID=A0A1I8IWL4_9PLAT
MTRLQQLPLSAPIGLFCFFSFCSCFISGVSSTELKVTQQLPPSITVRELSSLNLNCGLEPPPDYIIWSFAQAGQPLGNLIRCQPAKGTCGNVDETQAAFANVSVSATPNGSLLVDSVGQGQSGRYQCQGLLRLQSVRTETLVNVQ